MRLLFGRLSPPFNLMLGLLLLIADYPRRSDGWEFQRPPPSHPPKAVATRRSWMHNVLWRMGVVTTAVTTTTAILYDDPMMNTNTNGGNRHSRMAAYAACLPGDESPECIGVYKVPTTAGGGSSIPKSYDEAWQILQTQRLATEDILQVVRAGKLEEGGIKVLNLLPRVTAAGGLVVQTVLTMDQTTNSNSNNNSNNNNNNNNNKMNGIRQVRELQLESAWTDVLSSFHDCDILLGQGLRGELGALTAAQILILNELQDSIRAYDNFLLLAETFHTRRFIVGS